MVKGLKSEGAVYLSNSRRKYPTERQSIPSHTEWLVEDGQQIAVSGGEIDQCGYVWW